MQRSTGSDTRVEASPKLIDRARSDRQAFGEIYDLYLQRVYAFCLVHSGNQHEAEDLTSQTFERALQAIGRYEQRGAPFSSWLFRIAVNLATDRARRRGRVLLLGDDPPPEVPDGDLPEPNPEEWVVQWERAAWLRSHVAGLPPDQRRALHLRFSEGRSVAEVATRMDRNENATKQLLHRAVQNLRSRIGGRLEDHV